jgi:hypothetical protein
LNVSAFEVVRLDEAHIRDAYGCSLLLLRPDLHIFWRGEALSLATDQIALAATGHFDAEQSVSGAAG